MLRKLGETKRNKEYEIVSVIREDSPACPMTDHFDIVWGGLLRTQGQTRAESKFSPSPYSSRGRRLLRGLPLTQGPTLISSLAAFSTAAHSGELLRSILSGKLTVTTSPHTNPSERGTSSLAIPQWFKCWRWIEGGQCLSSTLLLSWIPACIWVHLVWYSGLGEIIVSLWLALWGIIDSENSSTMCDIKRVVRWVRRIFSSHHDFMFLRRRIHPSSTMSSLLSCALWNSLFADLVLKPRNWDTQMPRERCGRHPYLFILISCILIFFKEPNIFSVSKTATSYRLSNPNILEANRNCWIYSGGW